jgi:SAM-dependent methyltransferase
MDDFTQKTTKKRKTRKVTDFKTNYTGADQKSVNLENLEKPKKTRKRRTKKEKGITFRPEEAIDVPEEMFKSLKIEKPVKLIEPELTINESEQWWLKNGGDSWYDKVAERDLILEVNAQHQANLLLVTKAIKHTVGAKFENPSILEVGCGYGRILRLIQRIMPDKVNKLYGADISPLMIKKAIDLNVLQTNRFRIANVRNIHTVFEKKFDIVFTNTTLMHIPPEYIEEAVGSLLKTSCSYIVNIELAIPRSSSPATYGPVPNSSGGCWRHNLPDIYYKKGYTVSMLDQPGVDQMAYIVNVNNDIIEG